MNTKTGDLFDAKIQTCIYDVDCDIKEEHVITEASDELIITSIFERDRIVQVIDNFK